MVYTPPATRLLPCPRCRYDLRGRVVGEHCPECGWTIDTFGPVWWDDSLLKRMMLFARVAAIPCWILLLVPLHFIGVIGDLGSQRRFDLEATLAMFCIFMPIQVIAQAIAMFAIADTRLGESRARALFWAAIVRVAAFGLAAFVLYLEWSVAVGRLMAVSYFVLPLFAVGSDIVTSRVLASLEAEACPLLWTKPRTRVKVARGALWIVYPFLLVPFLGWYFAPIIWTVAMAWCFGELRGVADASRTAERSLRAGAAPLP
jgi:uncharacterized membrane protein